MLELLGLLAVVIVGGIVLGVVGLVVWLVSAVSSLRKPSGLSMAQGSEPRPPALDTATASSCPCTPAIGAWMMG